MTTKVEQAIKIAEDINKEKENDIKAKADQDVKKAEEAKLAQEKEKLDAQTPEEKETIAKAVVQEAEDVKVLETEDKDLNEEQKTRKGVLLKEKEDKMTPEERIQGIKDSTQKRIDELIGKIKNLEENDSKNSDEIKRIQIEKDALENKIDQPHKAQTKEKLIADFEVNLIQEFTEADKDKPLAERREMTDEDLEQFLLDDLSGATRWVARQERRRELDIEKFEHSLAQPTDAQKQAAKEFLDSQGASLKKLVTKYPKILPSEEQKTRLAGKTVGEVKKILMEESEEYRMCQEITDSDPKYIQQVDGPELVMAEMDKRLNKSGSITLTEEELNQKVKEAADAEIARRATVDETPTSKGGKKVNKESKKSSFEQKQDEIAKKAGLSQESLDAARSRRNEIPGAANNDKASFEE